MTLNLPETCKYFDLDDETLNFTNLQHISYNFNCMHLNIQSLSAKFDELKLLLAKLAGKGIDLDVIMFCETFLHSGNENLFNIPLYKLVSRNRSNTSRGGVCIYVKDTIQFEERNDLTIFDEGKFESIFIETTNMRKNIVVGEIYRIPNSNVALSLEYYDKIVSGIRGNAIIGTDQNFDLLKSISHTATTELLNNFMTHSFLPTINKPTRITHHCATLIDNIYVKIIERNNHLFSGVLLSDLSDHLPVFCLVSYYKNNDKSAQNHIIKHRKLTDDILRQMNIAVCDINWDFLDGLTVNGAYEQFIINIQLCLQICTWSSVSFTVTAIHASPGLSRKGHKAEYHIQVAIIQTQNDSCMSKYRIYGSKTVE